ncbi:MAG: hypothetical protein ACYC7J_20960 [Syntrophales bacterium]
MVHRVLAIASVMLVVLGAVPVRGWCEEAGRKEILDNPTVTYRKGDLSVAVPAETWEQILDNLYLMGQLWQLYRFQPSYRVTRLDADTIRVVDPSGISGEIVQVDRSARSRTFFASGKFDHWAVPSFFTADGVVIFSYRTDRQWIVGELTIFLRGNNWVSRFVMHTFSGVLTRRIDSRLKSNWEDTKKIIRDIVTDPERISSTLPPPLRDDFERLFSPAQRPLEVHSLGRPQPVSISE